MRRDASCYSYWYVGKEHTCTLLNFSAFSHSNLEYILKQTISSYHTSSTRFDAIKAQQESNFNMNWRKSWHQGLVKTLLSLIYRTQKHSAIIYFRTLLTEAKANRLLLLLVIFFLFFWRYLLASTTSHRTTLILLNQTMQRPETT